MGLDSFHALTEVLWGVADVWERDEALVPPVHRRTRHFHFGPPYEFPLRDPQRRTQSRAESEHTEEQVGRETSAQIHISTLIPLLEADRLLSDTDKSTKGSGTECER